MIMMISRMTRPIGQINKMINSRPYYADNLSVLRNDISQDFCRNNSKLSIIITGVDINGIVIVTEPEPEVTDITRNNAGGMFVQY